MKFSIRNKIIIYCFGLTFVSSCSSKELRVLNEHSIGDPFSHLDSIDRKTVDKMKGILERMEENEITENSIRLLQTTSWGKGYLYLIDIDKSILVKKTFNLKRSGIYFDRDTIVDISSPNITELTSNIQLIKNDFNVVFDGDNYLYESYFKGNYNSFYSSSIQPSFNLIKELDKVKS